MADLSSGAFSGGRRRHSRRNRRPIAEINVTPFVDVMLVLLIVFMIAAPMLSVGVDVDLPKVEAEALSANVEQSITVQIDETGQITMENTMFSAAALVEKIRANFGETALSRRVYILGDAQASHGAVMEVMGQLQQAGFTKLTIPTQGGGSEASVP